MRGVLRRTGRRLAGPVASARMAWWAPFSRLFVVGDGIGWALDEEGRHLRWMARRLGIHRASARWLPWVRHQAVFYCSQFVLQDDTLAATTHRVGIAYFHGRPGTGVPEFDRTFQGLCRHHPRVTRVRVSHSDMRDVVLESGIDPARVHLIPIAVDLDRFAVQSPESRRRARARLGIPDTAVVVGSLLKDGVGWKDGLEPKVIKGPDLLLRTLERLKPRVPGLLVLLSGPARGYVKAGLERLGIPYRHTFVRQYREVGQLFQALDVCLITSRQEGGPKAVLEAMASGVSVVTTRVGQAMDLVRHGENGWMVEVEDVDGLARWTEHAALRPMGLPNLLAAARRTAEANSLVAQIPLWRRLLDGFVEGRRGTRCE
jgi:glycosyltransferase involved in cell wall biosynthesis